MRLIVIIAHLFSCLALGNGENGGDGNNSFASVYGGNGGNGRAHDYDVYLCMDPSHAHNRGYTDGYKKMVYTYVNGQKTECMTEREFHDRFVAASALPNPPEKGITPVRRPVHVQDFSGKDFSEHDMYEMNLSNAVLRNANFFRADMRKICLRNADCSGASFKGALVKWGDLSGADLSEADLSGAYFVGCDLTGAKGLDADVLMRAQCIYNCRMDDETYDIILRICPNKLYDASDNWTVEEMERRLGK